MDATGQEVPKMKHILIRFTALLAACPALLRAVDTPLTFADPKPQRYELTARASVIDPRAKPHPEIDFVFEKGGKPADAENASVESLPMTNPRKSFSANEMALCTPSTTSAPKVFILE